MKDWKELSLTKKALIGIAILLVAAIAPELMILVDVGGIELAFSFLLFQYKPLLEWFKHKSENLIVDLKIAKAIILSRALARPKIFTLNVAYCTVMMLMTGSLFLFYGFFLPALFVNGGPI